MNKARCAAIMAIALAMMTIFSSCASAKRLYKWKQKVSPMIVPTRMVSEGSGETDAWQVKRQRKKARRGMDRIDRKLRRQYKTEHKLRLRRAELTEDWLKLNDIY